MTPEDTIYWWRVNQKGTPKIVPLTTPDEPEDTVHVKHFRKLSQARDCFDQILDTRVMAAKRELERQRAIAKRSREIMRKDIRPFMK